MVDAIRLIERTPQMTASEIASEFIPPPQFADARFGNYRPDPSFPSQRDAVELLERFANDDGSRPSGFFAWGKRAATEKPGVYLDGGFGVGKTHLLAALWHTCRGRRKVFGTFIEYTALVGALGYAETVRLLTGTDLICIDEFELDDPGDTMLMSRLLGELMASGTRVAATSNTPPNALGEGRFAAADFLREINALASNFVTLRIDGTDYRRRSTSGAAVTLPDRDWQRTVDALLDAGHPVAVESFADLVGHLSRVHPSRYIKLLTGVEILAVRDAYQLHNQNDALRWVAFIDRVYDAEIPIVASGLELSDIFDADMLGGGFAKKYQRCISRMIALTSGDLPTSTAA